MYELPQQIHKQLRPIKGGNTMTISIRKLLLLSCFILLMTASFAFADEVEEKPFYNRMVTLLENHHPDELEDWINKFEEHEAVHNDIQEMRTNLKDTVESLTGISREEVETKKIELKSAVEAEELTPEEARAEFQVFIEPYKALKEEHEVERQAHKAELELLKADLLSNKDLRIAKRQELKEAIITESDTTTIQGIIDELIALQEIHLALDYDVLSYLTAIYNSII